MRMGMIPIEVGTFETASKTFHGKGTGKMGNRMTNRDYPDYSIVEIGQNTEKSPGASGLVVTQTPGKDH